MGRLQELRQRKSNLIRDSSVLVPSYIPETLIGRDKELDELSLPLLRILDSNGPGGTTLLYGASGAGKTASIQAVLTDFRAELREKGLANKYAVVYTHAQKGDKAQIPRDIAISIDQDLKPVVTKNNDPQKVFAILEERCKELGLKGIVLVVDEAHLLREDLDFILSKLSRKEAGLTIPVQLFLISNNLDWKDQLAVRVTSGLDVRREIRFADYTSDQLQEILKDRIERAFHEDAVPDGVVALTASLTALHFNSDARAAIRLLVIAADDAEMENKPAIEEVHVRHAQDKLTREIERDGLLSLARQHRFAMAALWLLAKRGLSHAPLNVIYDAHVALYRHLRQDAPGQKSLSNYLDGLEQLAYVEVTALRTSAKGGRPAKWYAAKGLEAIEDMMRADENLAYVMSDPGAIRLPDERLRAARKVLQARLPSAS